MHVLNNVKYSTEAQVLRIKNSRRLISAANSGANQPKNLEQSFLMNEKNSTPAPKGGHLP
ncbi:hypothetical protein FACS1894113_5620 [Alphaproteobacteria bacterium]|nr:hypothetical protein FACS1894113_5620 [Alphaproteobacteria bacterium]